MSHLSTLALRCCRWSFTIKFQTAAGRKLRSQQFLLWDVSPLSCVFVLRHDWNWFFTVSSTWSTFSHFIIEVQEKRKQEKSDTSFALQAVNKDKIIETHRGISVPVCVCVCRLISAPVAAAAWLGNSQQTLSPRLRPSPQLEEQQQRDTLAAPPATPPSHRVAADDRTPVTCWRKLCTVAEKNSWLQRKLSVH